MENRNKVVLVDEHDATLGEMDKMEAHEKGVMHRAFSIFLFNKSEEMLIQQRANEKYHGAGLWTNACCSHPQLGEDVLESALGRLRFEMGLSCDIEKAFSFSYKTEVENNLIEHEFDHVFVGYTDDEPTLNLEEAQSFKWLNMSAIQNDIQNNPSKYTYWFKMAFPSIASFMENKTCKKKNR